jgi:S-adenosylmethionine decarboxylase proenzyme
MREGALETRSGLGEPRIVGGRTAAAAARLRIIAAMQGLHLTADLHDCALGGEFDGMPVAALFVDPSALRTLCLRAVAQAGLAAVGERFHRFEGGGGVTGVVLLAESHLAVHTWPELRAVTLDVYVCNYGADNSARAEALLARLEAAFAAGRIERQRLQRG